MKFWNWINGNKTSIGAILLLIVNSAYIESLITNPDLYTLAQSIASAILGVGIIHKVGKKLNKYNNAQTN